MTTGLEDRYKGGNSKTLDDIYYAIRSVDSKVEEILDEIGTLEYTREDEHKGWSIDDLYDNEHY